MTTIESLIPSERKRVYDIVAEAGIDISDWEESKGNAPSAASNPKYCYNWSFIEPEKCVLLNLWHNDIKLYKRKPTIMWNARDIANVTTGITKKRASDMDKAIELAFRKKLPLRIMLCIGSRRNRRDTSSPPSRVKFRKLDSDFWHISSYNNDTGLARIVRGPGKTKPMYLDQFNSEALDLGIPDKKPSSTQRFTRSSKVRRLVLLRAAGRCEYCGKPGFITKEGSIYLETHHIIPLAERGKDSTSNVVALCPNHHREAHHGAANEKIFRALQRKLFS